LGFGRFFFMKSKLQQRGFFAALYEFFDFGAIRSSLSYRGANEVGLLGFSLGTSGSGEELIRTRALLEFVLG
jgi:hypothetical protein